MKSAMQIMVNHLTTRIAPSTNAWLSVGTKDKILFAFPPEIKLKSAGMMGSERTVILILLATPNAVIATPKISVASQNLLRTKMRTR